MFGFGKRECKNLNTYSHDCEIVNDIKEKQKEIEELKKEKKRLVLSQKCRINKNNEAFMILMSLDNELDHVKEVYIRHPSSSLAEVKISQIIGKLISTGCITKSDFSDAVYQEVRNEEIETQIAELEHKIEKLKKNLGIQ